MLVDPDPPLTFERVTRAKVAGCLAYMLMIPVAGIVGALIGGLLAYAIAAVVGARDDVGTMMFLILAPLCFIGCIAWGIRDFWRRSDNRIVLHRDRLELHRRNIPEAWRYDEIDWIEAPSLAYMREKPPDLILNRRQDNTYALIRGRDGRRLVLRAEEWPLREIALALFDRAVPVMVRRLTERLDSGETVEFRASPLLALRFLLVGLLCSGLGGSMAYVHFTSTQSSGALRWGVPLFLLLTGLSALFMVARARGGIVVDRDGVRRRRKDPLIPWDRIRRLNVLTDAANIETDEGTISLGMLARNYEACLALLRRRIRAKD